ncbi:hypothetical protein CK510_15010 [Brunnivagina elsteri CCALA 953]|uniref:Uncharacterized protein n=1 Tax=Brunnivagina elsteri CCALA 953 TaxID=987040 RepID=A0A2A2THX3_9CYAN|nr:hypothetical protein CK510_15010 [Calothrix elsteri CCALA 953]
MNVLNRLYLLADDKKKIKPTIGKIIDIYDSNIEKLTFRISMLYARCIKQSPINTGGIIAEKIYQSQVK